MALHEASIDLTVRAPGHVRAVLPMIGCSMMLSFSGLTVLSMQDADAWRVSMHRT